MPPGVNDEQDFTKCGLADCVKPDFAPPLISGGLDSILVKENGHGVVESETAMGFRPFALRLVPFKGHLLPIVRTRLYVCKSRMMPPLDTIMQLR